MTCSSQTESSVSHLWFFLRKSVWLKYILGLSRHDGIILIFVVCRMKHYIVMVAFQKKQQSRTIFSVPATVPLCAAVWFFPASGPIFG